MFNELNKAIALASVAKKSFENKLLIGFNFWSMFRVCFSAPFSIDFVRFLAASSINFVCFSKAFPKLE